MTKSSGPLTDRFIVSSIKHEECLESLKRRVCTTVKTNDTNPRLRDVSIIYDLFQISSVSAVVHFNLVYEPECFGFYLNM